MGKTSNKRTARKARAAKVARPRTTKRPRKLLDAKKHAGAIPGMSDWALEEARGGVVMKTVFEMPDELLQQVKARAAVEGRRLTDLVADLLRTGLKTRAKIEATGSGKWILPVIDCDPAKPGEEITPDRVAAILWGSCE